MHQQPKTCNGTDEPCVPCICGADKQPNSIAFVATDTERRGPVVHNLQPKDK